MRRFIAALMAAAGVAAAAPAPVRVAPAPPPYAGIYQPVGVDEIGLWRDQDEDERVLANSPILIRDETLNGYVRGVLCATVGAERCKAARIYLLRSPVSNASMAPNGTMRIFSGLLLRVRDEAELASVLGHEFGHFEQRHSLSGFKSRRASTDLLSWAAVLTSMSSGVALYSDYNQLQLSVYGGFHRFQRDQEREADLLGIGYLNGSTLRPQSAAAFWQHAMAEATASSAARGQRKPTFDKIAFFATHPPEAERAGTMTALAVPDGATRDAGADRYARAIAPWLPVFLNDQIKLNDFGGSDYIIGALAERGWTAPLWLARGDLYRARGHPRDLVNAAEFYASAVALDPAAPDAHRGLGLSLFKTGRRGEGQVALRRYLQLRPDAPDAAMIGTLISADGGIQ